MEVNQKSIFLKISVLPSKAPIEPVTTIKPSKITTPNIISEIKQSKNLFSDSDSDEKEYFIPPIPKKKEETVQAPETTEKSQPLATKEIPKSVEKEPVVVTLPKKKGLFDESDDDDENIPVKKESLKNVESKSPTLPAKIEKEEEKIEPETKNDSIISSIRERRNLFGSSEESSEESKEEDKVPAPKPEPEIAPDTKSDGSLTPIQQNVSMDSDLSYVSAVNPTQSTSDTNNDNFYSQLTTPRSETFESLPSSSLTYQNFFSDLPPDDTGDFDDAYNDDFAEPDEVMNATPIADPYLIRDEPPPDDNDDGGNSTIVDDKKSFKEKFSMFQDAAKPKLPEPVVEKPLKGPPKKLNVNLNINVGALLPGAKRPKMDVKVEETTPPEIQKKAEQIEEGQPKEQEIINRTPKFNTPATETKGGLLVSLNKNRAKLPNRRPSTRKARHETFLKNNQDENEDTDAPSKPITVAEMLKNEERRKTFSRKSLVFEEDENIEEKLGEISSKIEKIKKPEKETKKIEVESQIQPKKSTEKTGLPIEEPKKETIEPPKELVKETTKPAKDIRTKPIESENKVKEELPAKTTKSSSEAEKSLEKPAKSMVQPSPQNKSREESKNLPSKPPLEPINKSLVTQKVEHIEPLGATKSIESKEEKKTPKTSEQIEEPTKKTSPNRKPIIFEKEPASEPSKIEKPVKPKNPLLSSSLFDDEDDDDFDFLPKAKPKVEEKVFTKKSNPAPVSLFEDKEEDDDLFGAQAPPPLPPPSVATKTDQKPKVSLSSNLFNDDDDDDDDLFASSAKTIKVQAKEKIPAKISKEPEVVKVTVVQQKEVPTVQKKSSKAASLFDDDDLDDDIFSIKKTLPVKQNVPKKAPKATSLFGSDDEDDDLFGSSKVEKSTTKAASSKAGKFFNYFF